MGRKFVLKQFTVIEAGWSDELATDAAVLECPHTACHERFQVDRAAFKEGRITNARKETAIHILNRPCPYCFRVAELPSSAPPRSR